jgi:hypothetical protein
MEQAFVAGARVGQRERRGRPGRARGAKLGEAALYSQHHTHIMDQLLAVNQHQQQL